MSKRSKTQIDKYAGDADEWRRAARANYNGAMYLFESTNPFHCFPASILGHHALEQILKSALICTGCKVAYGEQKDGFVWGHKLAELAALLKKRCPTFPLGEFPKVFSIFDAYFEEFRYPREPEKHDGLGQYEAELFKDCFLKIEKFVFSMPGAQEA